MTYALPDDSEATIYQLQTLGDAGFIVWSPFKQGGSVTRLTWQGHDFLDAVRNESVWNSTKAKVGKAVGSASLEVIRAVADGFTRSMLGIS